MPPGTVFPYTTLFRSLSPGDDLAGGIVGRIADTALKKLHLHDIAFQSALRGHSDIDLPRLDVGDSVVVSDMRLGHRLDPDTLPDTRHSGVPDATRRPDLLAARLEIIIRRILDPDNQCVVAGLQIRSDVEREMGVTSCVSADLDVVDNNISLPVHSLKVEHQTLPLPCGRNPESRPVP